MTSDFFETKSVPVSITNELLSSTITDIPKEKNDAIYVLIQNGEIFCYHNTFQDAKDKLTLLVDLSILRESHVLFQSITSVTYNSFNDEILQAEISTRNPNFLCMYSRVVDLIQMRKVRVGR